MKKVGIIGVNLRDPRQTKVFTSVREAARFIGDEGYRSSISNAIALDNGGFDVVQGSRHKWYLERIV